MNLPRFTVFVVHSLAGITRLALPMPAAFAQGTTLQGASSRNMLGRLSVSFYGGYAILGILFFVLPGANAQMTIHPPKPSMTTVSPALLPTATCDPLAIRALHKVIEASGGMKAWNGIHSAEIRLAITPSGAIQAHDFLMLDD